MAFQPQNTKHGFFSIFNREKFHHLITMFSYDKQEQMLGETNCSTLSLSFISNVIPLKASLNSYIYSIIHRYIAV
jgi:hypothetical protein